MKKIRRKWTHRKQPLARRKMANAAGGGSVLPLTELAASAPTGLAAAAAVGETGCNSKICGAGAAAAGVVEPAAAAAVVVEAAAAVVEVAAAVPAVVEATAAIPAVHGATAVAAAKKGHSIATGRANKSAPVLESDTRRAARIAKEAALEAEAAAAKMQSNTESWCER